MAGDHSVCFAAFVRDGPNWFLRSENLSTASNCEQSTTATPMARALEMRCSCRAAADLDGIAAAPAVGGCLPIAGVMYSAET